MTKHVLDDKELIDALQDETVEYLFVHHPTKHFPEINNAKHLLMLFADNNNLQNFPPLHLLTNLVLLYVDRNKLKSFPSTDNLVYLQGLAVDNNNLNALHEHNSTIEYLYISDNNYPKWLNYTNLIL